MVGCLEALRLGKVRKEADRDGMGEGRKTGEGVMGHDRNEDDSTDADTVIVSSLFPPTYG